VRTLTIGEVLGELKEEFEDITISKIRFLESEGLIQPDRTESGYRKFSDSDIERLRYVLRTQRDRYLPLKVIREELEQLDAGRTVEPKAPPPPPNGKSGGRAPAEPVVDDLAPTADLDTAGLCGATGLEPAQIRSLADHGILRSEEPFDGDDLRVAQAAAALIELGLEPRHLRMYRQFADREVALCEQLVGPLLKQRNPDSRRLAAERADALTRRGAELQRLLLGRDVRALLGS
jgi:DNA-binding transcriptional MerR regulator